VLAGLDCGALGTWVVSATAHPLDLRPTTRADLRRRLVDLLPPDAVDVVARSQPADRPADRLEGRA
jgi:hypothetical protein